MITIQPLCTQKDIYSDGVVTDTISLLFHFSPANDVNWWGIFVGKSPPTGKEVLSVALMFFPDLLVPSNILPAVSHTPGHFQEVLQ